LPSVPLYKILTVQAAYGRGMATDDRDTLAEIASIDLLYAVLDRIVSEAGRSMASFIAADEAKLAIWRSQVADVRSSLAQRQATGQAKVSAIMPDHRENGDDREHAGCLDVPINGRIARLVARPPGRAPSSLKAKTCHDRDLHGRRRRVHRQCPQCRRELDRRGGYKSLIQVTMVMGLALAVIVLAFNQDWRAWLNWFLGATDARLHVPDGAGDRTSM